MLAWSEGTNHGRQKTEIMVMTCVGGELFAVTPITLANFTPAGALKSTSWTALSASFPLVGCLPQAAWPEKTSLRKVRTLWHCSRLRSVALYL